MSTSSSPPSPVLPIPPPDGRRPLSMWNFCFPPLSPQDFFKGAIKYPPRPKSWYTDYFGSLLLLMPMEIYGILFWFFFYRELSTWGTWRVPREGPLFVCINHSSCYADAGISFCVIPRSVNAMLGKAATRKSVIFSAFMRLFRAVIVTRPGTIDVDQFKASGQLIEVKGSVVEGQETRFLKELSPGSWIYWKVPGATQVAAAVVAKVESDTRLELKHQAAEEDQYSISSAGAARNTSKSKQGKSFEVKNGGLSFKFSHKIGHEEMYGRVNECLAEDIPIVMLPEGFSHDCSHMQPLKPGVVVMALYYAAKCGVLPKLLPLGITFNKYYSVNSRVNTECGEAIAPTWEMVEDFKAGGERKSRAIDALTQQLTTSLWDVTINAKDWGIRNLAHMLRRLYQPVDTALALPDYHHLIRRFIAVGEKYEDDSVFKKLRYEVESYFASCEALGLRDCQVVTLLPGSTGCFDKTPDSLPIGATPLLALRRLVAIVCLSIVLAPLSPFALLSCLCSSLLAKKREPQYRRDFPSRDKADDMKPSNHLEASYFSYQFYAAVVAALAWAWYGFQYAILVEILVLPVMLCWTKVAYYWFIEVTAAIPTLRTLTTPSYRRQCEELVKRRVALVLELQRDLPTLDGGLEEFMATRPNQHVKRSAPFSLRHRSLYAFPNRWFLMGYFRALAARRSSWDDL